MKQHAWVLRFVSYVKANSRQCLALTGVQHALLKTVCLTACLFGTSAFALDPQKAITQFVHTSWTEKDGAPTGIRMLAQTTDGYLWIGTAAGLFRFDGLRFVRFEPQAGESLPGVRIDRLLATGDGALWISSQSHAWCRLFNGHLSRLENIPPPYQLVEAPDGTLVAGTEKGVWRLTNGIWKDVSKEWNFPDRVARQIYFDRSGTLWIVTEARVVYRPAGQSEFVDAQQLPDYAQLRNFAEAPDGAMWISEVTRSAHSLLRKGERGLMTEVRVGAAWVLFDRNGSLWVASFGDGLRRVADPGKINGRQVAQFDPEAEQFTVKEGLTGNVVTSILEDREGNVWAGTFKGLDRFRESSFLPVATNQPEAPRFFQASRDGSLLVAGLSPKEVLRIGPLGNRKVLSDFNLSAMCEDETGVIWAIDNHFVFRYQQGRFVTVPLPGGVILGDYGSVACDGTGGVWLYDGQGGLFRLANGALTRFLDNPERAYSAGFPYADREGRIWLGQTNRVWLYDHGKSQVFGNNDGVPVGTISAFHLDRTGNLWAGGDGGLSKFENGRFRSLSQSNGLPAQSVAGIAEDDYGCLWLASDYGVLRVPIFELDRALADPAYLLRYESFDRLDGLPAKPQHIVPSPLARTLDGRIWVATTNGIAYVDPRRIPKNNLPPPVQIESLSASGRDYAPWDTLKLPARTTSLQITYTALSLTIPERVRFRYKLEAVENDWQEAGTRRTTSYSNLGPGAYRFRVIACNNDGVWNEVGTTLNFSILPAWYQTIWFRMLYAVLALFVIWMLYRLRLRQAARAMSVRFDERLAERTRIARELHDTLLQTVQGSKFVADDALEKYDDSVHVRRALERLSKWLGQATQEGRAALNSLRTSTIETNDLTAALRRATEECAIDSSMAVKFSATGGPRDMHPIARDEIYRIGYEAIRNACEHSSASELEITLTYAQDLTLRVNDNGSGIDPAIITEGKAGHFGLQGMRERAERIGSKFTLVSSPDSGTEMTLVVPGNVIFRKASATKIKKFFGLDGSSDPH
jgi:signal transduction histidine kinase/ligand-binding sensor domain-containing protein